MSIYAKLAKMRDEVGVIEKQGHNAHHHYNYVRAEDVTHRARDLFAEHGLFLAPRCVDHTRHDGLTVVHLHYDVVDLESGERETFPWVGEGSDKQDKGVYKAYTGGLKYFLMNLLMIPSNEDPEASGSAGERTSPSAQGPECPKCGGPMWDNRHDKRSARSPDYKCKDKKCGEAVWLDDDKDGPPPGVDPSTGEVTEDGLSESERAEAAARENPEPPPKVFTVEERTTMVARLTEIMEADKETKELTREQRTWVADMLRAKKRDFVVIEKGLAKLEATGQRVAA